MPNLHRRKFLQYSTQATLATVGIPGIINAAFKHQPVKSIRLEKNSVVLFQGDSVTDGGRERNPTKYNSSNADRSAEYNDCNVFGSGYAMLAGTRLLFNHPKKQFKIFNRGISGNKVHQLAERWKEDCLDLKPSVLSILIGVNDYWHTLSHGYKGTAETYRTDLTALIERTRQALPDVQLIIGEPFALKDVQAVTNEWYPAFDEYRAIARSIANDQKAVFVPYQKVFDEALSAAPASYWSFDGVHPSIPGNMLMANAWMKAVSVK